MEVLAEGRREGDTDERIAAAAPVVLALVPPGIGRPLRLPADLPAGMRRAAPAGPSREEIVLREALRLRIRWVQELSARAAAELGRRLVAAEVLDDPEQIRCAAFP